MPELISDAPVIRRAEYFAGRYCARKCLNMGDSHQQILTGINREPEWPIGTVGSITHSGAICAVAVSKVKGVIGIGLDIERIVSDEIAEEVSSQIMENDEWLMQHSLNIPSRLFFTIVFSAKETFFKATHKFVGDYFGFDTVRFKEIRQNSVILEIMSSLRGVFKRGSRVIIKFSIFEQSHVITSLEIDQNSTWLKGV